MTTAAPITSGKTYMDNVTELKGRGPLREPISIPNATFNATINYESKTQPYDVINQYPLNEGSIQWQMLQKTNNFPQYLKNTYGVQGLYGFQNEWTAHEKTWVAKGFGPAQYGMPTGAFQIINPNWDKNPNFYGSSSLNEAFALADEQGPTPYATNDYLTLQMWASNEDYQSSIHNPMSATWALTHQTNNLLAMQAQGIIDKQFQGSVQVNQASQTLQAEQAAANARFQNTISHDQFINGTVMKNDPVAEENAKRAGKKWNPDKGTYDDDPNFNLQTGESKAKALATGLPPDAPPGSSLYSKSGKRATSGHYYDPKGVLVNWQGQSKRKRQFEHGEATARKDAMYAGYAAAALGAAALTATGVGAVVAPALLATYAGGMAAAGVGSAVAGTAAAGVQTAATYTDPETTYAMRKAAVTNLAINAGMTLGGAALASGGELIASGATAALDNALGEGTSATLANAANGVYTRFGTATRAALGVDEATYGTERAAQIYSARAAGSDLPPAGYNKVSTEDMDAVELENIANEHGDVYNPMQQERPVHENGVVMNPMHEPNEDVMPELEPNPHDLRHNLEVRQPIRNYGGDEWDIGQIENKVEINPADEPFGDDNIELAPQQTKGKIPKGIRKRTILMHRILQNWYGRFKYARGQGGREWSEWNLNQYLKKEFGPNVRTSTLPESRNNYMLTIEEQIGDKVKYHTFFRGAREEGFNEYFQGAYKMVTSKQVPNMQQAIDGYMTFAASQNLTADNAELYGYCFGSQIANDIATETGQRAYLLSPLSTPHTTPAKNAVLIHNPKDPFNVFWTKNPFANRNKIYRFDPVDYNYFH